jgi:hypothetical protein
MTTSSANPKYVEQCASSGDYRTVVSMAVNADGEFSKKASAYAVKKVAAAVNKAIANEKGYAMQGLEGGLDGLAQIARAEGVPVILRMKAIDCMADVLHTLISNDKKGDEEMAGDVRKLDSLANDKLLPKVLKSRALDKVIGVMEAWVDSRKKQAAEMRANHAEFVARAGMPDKKMNGRKLVTV